MHFRITSSVILLLSMVACGPSERVLTIPDAGYRFEVNQRRSAEIPSTVGQFFVRLGDITNGQVQVTATDEQGTIYIDQSMTDGARASFHYGTKDYTLEITELVNVLIGDDHAAIVISRH